MEFLKKISFDVLKENLKQAVLRFPISFIFIVGLIATAIYGYENKSHDDFVIVLKSRLFFYTISGFFISIPLKIWAEKFESKIKGLLLQIVPLIIWFVISYFVLRIPFIDQEIFSIPLIMALSVFAIVVYFTLIFISQKTDICHWNFMLRNVWMLIVSAFVTGIFHGGIAIVCAALEMLFDIEISNRVYVYLSILSWCGLWPTVFLSMFPSKDQTFNSQIFSFNKVANIIFHVLFLGLLSIYLLILYVYGLKILFSMELPRGYVSVLVSICMFGMITVLYLLYPNTLKEGFGFDKKLYTILPILMLPLLLLMTIGIGKRISDYGLTISRLWLLIVNIWYYAVCVYILIAKERKMSWIPISFSLIFLIFSFGPWSVSNITHNYLKKSIKETLAQKNIDIPVTQEMYDKFNLKDSTYSQFQYFVEKFPKSCYDGLAIDTLSVRYYWTWNQDSAYLYCSSPYGGDKVFDVDANVKTLKYLDYEEFNFSPDEISKDTLEFDLPDKFDNPQHFKVLKKSFENQDSSIVMRNEKYIFLLDHFSYERPSSTDSTNVTLTGILVELK